MQQPAFTWRCVGRSTIWQGLQASHGLNQGVCASQCGPGNHWESLLEMQILTELAVWNMGAQEIPMPWGLKSWSSSQWSNSQKPATVILPWETAETAMLAPLVLDGCDIDLFVCLFVFQLPKELKYAARFENYTCHTKGRILKSENWAQMIALLITEWPLHDSTLKHSVFHFVHLLWGG